MTLESKHYLATDADIKQVAEVVLEARSAEANGKESYLRILAAKTIAALGAPSRARTAKVPKLSPEDIKLHVAAFEQTHEHCYNIVTAAIDERVPAHQRGRGTEINRLANFARTSASSIRTWIKAGNDITAVVVDKLTKSMLKVANRPRRSPSVAVLKQQAENQSKRLITKLLALAEADKGAAVTEFRLLMGQLATQLQEMAGGKVTRKMDVAAAELMPLRIGSTVFVPTESQVLRQEARPS